jgi:hypothetical protein
MVISLLGIWDATGLIGVPEPVIRDRLVMADWRSSLIPYVCPLRLHKAFGPTPQRD